MPDSPGELTALNVTPPLRTYLSTLWKRREFALAMSAGEFKAKNANMSLGSLWHLINPLLQLGVYWLVFGLLLRVDRGVSNFIGFLAAGIFVFQFSQRSITGGASAISKNLGLIRSLQFPRALLPISAVLKEALTLRVALLVAAAILLITGEGITVWWLLAIPVFVLQVLFNLGGALIAARLADRVKDIENVLPFVFRLLFYASGVLFLADSFVGDFENVELWRALFIVNPLYCFVSLARHYLMTTITQDHVGLMWLSAVGWTLAVFVLGLVFFRAGESTYGRG
jgi:teichoic acid transport system permease protein